MKSGNRFYLENEFVSAVKSIFITPLPFCVLCSLQWGWQGRGFSAALQQERPQLHTLSPWGARAGTAVLAEGIPSLIKLIYSSKLA